MGEGKKDQSSKRQRSTRRIDKSSSDSELAPNKKKGRKNKDKERWPFLDGLTVDGLARYRRRRVQGRQKDSLGEHCEINDSDKDFVSEYRRAFRASSEDILKQQNIWPVKSKPIEDSSQLEDTTDNAQFSNYEDFKKDELLSGRTDDRSSSIALIDDSTIMETENSKFVAHANPIGRPPLIRRGTSLKRGGEFYTDTETYSSYVPYEGQHRAELARRPTSLRMEGDLETMTEKCEKFIEWLNVSRPEIMRIPTNLKMEGEFESTTENHEKYIPFVGVRRPELLRQGANLKLDGETNFTAEYADVFKEHRIRGRENPILPETHLKTEGDFHRTTEISENFINPRMREMFLMEQLAKDAEEEEKKRQEAKEREAEDENIKLLVSKLEDLKGPPLEIPEYKDAYKDFPRERPKLIKPEDEIGRADGTKVPSSPAHSRFSTKIDQDPEYKSKYLDYPKERPIYRKPPIQRSIISSPKRTSAEFARYRHPEYHFHDDEPTSEVRSQYVPYGRVPRVETLKMPANLRLEGNLDLQPEYRNAYCTTKIPHQELNESRMHRHRDRSSSASRKMENYWMSNDNGEQFGRINAAHDQDAFQVVSTRVHEENVVGKPPTGSRRGSRGSQIQRPSQLDIAPRSTIKTRSPSPTYRLHVCNVDDEPRGFGRRRRSPPQSSENLNNSTSNALLLDEDNNRPYSPSFGRKQPNGQAFVVLDNTLDRDSSKRENRRKRIDRNCNVDERSPISRTRPRTPTNWMPPWYDSTSTI